MSLWIVQRLDLTHRPATFGESRWVDITPRHPIRAWDADSAGGAFRLAVLENERERVQEATYRILPFSGGASFHVGLNVDAEEHDEKADAA